MLIRKAAVNALLTSLLLCALCGQGLASHLHHEHTYKLSGSGSGLASVRLLAKAFHKQHPHIQIQVLPSLGTTGGIMALLDGAIDLCLAARPLLPQEETLDISYLPYASTVIAFVTHVDTESNTLSESEIIEILSGTRTHWPDGSYIRLVMRSARESDFIPIIKFSRPFAAAMTTAINRKDVVFSSTAQDNVQTLRSLPGAFGLVSLAQLTSERVDLKPLAYENIAPTIANLKNGSYPFSKTFALITKNQQLPAALNSFVNFVQSEQACNILMANGHLCKEN